MGAHYLQMRAVGSKPNNNPNNEQTENKGNTDPIQSNTNQPLRCLQGHIGVLSVNMMQKVQIKCSCQLAGHGTSLVALQGLAKHRMHQVWLA